MKHLMGPVPGLALLMAVAMPAWAADIAVTMKKATQDGTGETLGRVTISASEPGATFRLDLHGLPPGTHGFHVHQNPTCGPTLMGGLLIPAGAAGEHFDPENTGRHAGPSGNGHLGDLPVIEVGAGGTAKQTLVAPRIADTEVLRKHTLIIQLGGDNYSDSPARDGGGGGRFACGVIE